MDYKTLSVKTFIEDMNGKGDHDEDGSVPHQSTP